MSGSPSHRHHQYPWIAGGLSIDRPALDAVIAHAIEGYPSECCGFLSGPAREPLRVDTAIPADNQADRYHRHDPKTFPRTSRTYFKIDELLAGRLFDRGEQEGQPIKAIYHSHCDAGAHFSDEDAATFACEGQLMWPCAFLVVSVMGGEHADTRLWVHTPGTDDFHASTLSVGARETRS